MWVVAVHIARVMSIDWRGSKLHACLEMRSDEYEVFDNLNDADEEGVEST